MHPCISWRRQIPSISVADPGCLFRIPDPNFFPSRIPDPNFLHPGSRILVKNLSILTPKKPKKYDLGCSSRIPGPDADFLPIPDPGSRGQKGTRSRIRNTGLSLVLYSEQNLSFCPLQYHRGALYDPVMRDAFCCLFPSLTSLKPHGNLHRKQFYESGMFISDPGFSTPNPESRFFHPRSPQH
jgi:hypothetical protein